MLVWMALLLACDPQPLHADCGGPATCEAGAQCVPWSTIAGETVRTCEIPCGAGGACPDELECHSYSDGPQNICEPGLL